MPLWNELEGRRIAERYPLKALLRSEGRAAWFETESPEGVRLILSVWEAMNDDDALLARLQAASRVAHPNLQVIRETGSALVDDDPLVFAVLESYDQILTNVLESRPLTTDEAAEVAESLLAALEAVHAAGLIHGRVEPASVLAVGETIKLRSDCLNRGGDHARREDVRGFAATLYQAMTQRSVISGADAAMLPVPYASIIRNGLGGQWTLADVRRALKGPAVETMTGPERSQGATLPPNPSPPSASGRIASPASPSAASSAASPSPAPAVSVAPATPASPAEAAPSPAKDASAQPAAAGARSGGTDNTESMAPLRHAPESLAAESPLSPTPASSSPEDFPAGSLRATDAEASAASRQQPSAPLAGSAVPRRESAGIAPAPPRRRPGVSLVALAVMALLLIFFWWIFHRRPAPTTLTGAAPQVTPAAPNASKALPGGASVHPGEAAGQAMGEPGAAPAEPVPPAQSKPSPAALAATAANARSNWRVIAYTYESQQKAQAMAAKLAQQHADLQPQVFSPTGHAPYLVTLGGPMTRQDAFSLRDKAREAGLPRDTYAQNYSK